MNENKAQERLFDHMPNNQTTLQETITIQDRARQAGFDWKNREEVWDKVKEELTELVVEVKKLDADKMEEEFGDLLFSMINAARLYDIDPEMALKRCNKKFKSRFNHIEDHAIWRGKQVKDMTSDEMIAYWNEAKAIERGLKQ